MMGIKLMVNLDIAKISVQMIFHSSKILKPTLTAQKKVLLVLKDSAVVLPLRNLPKNPKKKTKKKNKVVKTEKQQLVVLYATMLMPQHGLTQMMTWNWVLNAMEPLHLQLFPLLLLPISWLEFDTPILNK